MSDQDQVIEPGEGFEDHFCEASGTGSWVVEREVYRRFLVTSRFELWDDPFPAPSSQASAMHQAESGHASTP
jgi:hypothetical protein